MSDTGIESGRKTSKKKTLFRVSQHATDFIHETCQLLITLCCQTGMVLINQKCDLCSHRVSFLASRIQNIA